MTIKVIVLFVLFSAVLSMGCINEEDVDFGPGSTAIPPSDRDVAEYNYKWITTNSIENFDVEEGQVYAIVTYRVKNNGYNTISTNPDYWIIDSFGTLHNHSKLTGLNIFNSTKTNMEHGEDITNDILFVIPENFGLISFEYKPLQGDKTILRNTSLYVRDFEWGAS